MTINKKITPAGEKPLVEYVSRHILLKLYVDLAQLASVFFIFQESMSSLAFLPISMLTTGSFGHFS